MEVPKNRERYNSAVEIVVVWSEQYDGWQIFFRPDVYLFDGYNSAIDFAKKITNEYNLPLVVKERQENNLLE